MYSLMPVQGQTLPMNLPISTTTGSKKQNFDILPPINNTFHLSIDHYETEEEGQRKFLYFVLARGMNMQKLTYMGLDTLCNCYN